MEKSLFDDLIDFDNATQMQGEVDTESTIEEVDEQEQEETTVEEQVEIPDNVDPDLMAHYDYLVQNQFIEPLEEFTTEAFEERLSSLPERYFDAAINSLHSDAQDLLAYVFQLSESADRTKIKEFLDTYFTDTTMDLDNESNAYEYLKTKLESTKLYKSEEKLNAYLDSLIEDGSLVELAKETYSSDENNLETKRQQEIEALKAQRISETQNVKQFYTDLYSELDSYEWKNERKQAIKQVLDPKIAAELNAEIAQSKKALIQLADFYSRYNRDTKEFDLSDYEIKANSKKVEANKDALKKGQISSIVNKFKTKTPQVTKQGGGSFWNDLKPIN